MSDPKPDVDGAHPAIMTGKAWRDFCETLRQTERIVLAEGVPDTPRDRAEGFRYLTRFLQAGLVSCMAHDDPDYPVLGRMMDYTWPWGLDNPDCLYLYAPLRGDADYRLWGNRGSANHIDIQANTGHYAEGRIAAWRTMDSLDGFDLVTDRNGDFELTLSAEPPGDEGQGNRLRLEPDAGFLLIRQYFNDWENERPADLLIERVGAEYPIPPARTEFVAARLEKLGRWLEKGASLWEEMSRGFLGMEPNSVLMHMPEDAGVHSGMRGQAYGMGNFHCEAGEAVIVELELPKCHHWGIGLANWYWESVEFATRQSSINGSQAHLDTDGMFRAVIAHDDPGVPNWLDPAGNSRGTLTIRFLNAEAGAKPSFRRLSASEVRSALPDETPTVSPEERAESLRLRHHAVLRRYRR
jgi:hypothetical protein